MKFTRRKELKVETRLNIIILALACQGVYGKRTKLAEDYQISRSFLYQLINAALFCLREFLNTENVKMSSNPIDLKTAIVLMRLEGKVSISSISEILQMQNYLHDSTGMISQTLTYLGEHLPNTLVTKQRHHVFFLSDEVFASNSPILITVEPVSTAILRIELAPNHDTDTWKHHFYILSENQFTPKGLGSDRGNGLVQGYQAVYEDLVWCSDHFHEFRGLIQLRATLERQAYATIWKEEKCLQQFEHARSEENLEKCLQKLDLASTDCEQKIAEYQLLNDVLDILFPSLYFFDPKTGQPRYPGQVKTDILTLMDLLDELSLEKLQVQTKKIREHIDDICICYQQVENIYKQLLKTIPFETLNYIGIAWQHDHQSHQHKGTMKKYHQNESNFWLGAAVSLLGENAETQIAQIFEEFNGMVRASSLVEMVNSQIRPYLNSCKGQITQAHLNLIMFYHNHHLYKSGKRKGKAPIEILTGEKLNKNWVELLFDTVYKTQ